MYRIREMRSADAPAVAQLVGDLKRMVRSAPSGGGKVGRELIEAMERQPDQYANFVAVRGSRVAGLLSMVFYRTLLGAGGTALINELMVASADRRSGVGTRLVQRAIAAARQRGMDTIEVGTERANRGARSFYESVGFDREYLLLGKALADRSSPSSPAGGGLNGLRTG